MKHWTAGLLIFIFFGFQNPGEKGRQKIGYTYNDSLVTIITDSLLIVIETNPLSCIVCLNELSSFFSSDSVPSNYYVVLKEYAGNTFERKEQARRYKGIFPRTAGILFENRSDKKTKIKTNTAFPYLILKKKGKQLVLDYNSIFKPDLDQVRIKSAIKSFN